ncbi:type II secretion system F family protein [Actinomycetaceae bacterium TAE3-ERU4]|nr:type II secretion system F family protein [Actinomycetaceae bacterium TAE3-ERU4]
MGVVLGTIWGCGLILIWWAAVSENPWKYRFPRFRYFTLLMREAGLFSTPVVLLPISMLVIFLMGFVLVLALTQTPLIGVIVASGLSALPVVILRGRADRRSRQISRLWPDIIDNIIAGVRSGMGLAEVLINLGEFGPPQLRADFQIFAADFRVSGNFSRALDKLKIRFSNPEADRLFEVLRLSREVGGSDLSLLLRDLAVMMRADLRIRGELESRQSWTRNAARLAVVSPWVVLLMITTRTGGINVYATWEGSLVLIIGMLVSILAYFLMNRTARLSTR